MARGEKRLVYTLEHQLNESDSGQFEVGEQRERNHRYYSLQPIGNEQRGRSHYISPDVLDSVENKKALFAETFFGARQTVHFISSGNAQPFEADAKTAYVNAALEKNCYHRLFRDGWHDAFVAKRMVVLATWVDDVETRRIAVQQANQMQVMQLISQQGDVVGVRQGNAQQQQGGLWTGEIEVDVADSGIDLMLIQPERYYRDPNAAYVEDAMWATYEEDVSKGTLIDRGYDIEQVKRLAMDYRFRSEEEDTSRKAHDRSWTRRRQHKRVEEQETVTSYRTWTWLEMWDHDPEIAEELGVEDDGQIRLYEVHWSQGEILEWEDGSGRAIKLADEIPFFEWCEYKVSHAEHGISDADIVAHSQKTNSIIKRLILDNQQMRNSSRYEALQGAIVNPRDLLDNSIGGVVWTRRLGSVAPLAAPELSPLTFNVLTMLSQDTDKRSGMSDLAKGMNTDAVRYQNAENMIDKLTVAGNRRVMRAARDWAQTFLVPLSQYIAKLAMDNDMSQRQMEVSGRVIPVVPSQWQDTELCMAVSEALTPEEGQKHAQQLMMMHSIMSQDPQLAMLYGVAQKHALMDDMFDALGVADTTKYMLRPDSPEFMQQMQQMQQQQMQAQQQQQQLAGLQIGLAQSADRREWEKFQWDVTNDMADNVREDDELEHKKEMDEKEYQLERTQDRAVSVG